MKGNTLMKKRLSDRQIMEELYRVYEQKMLLTAYSILQDYQQAEDAVQETFIKLSRHLSKLDDITSKKSRNYIFITTKGIAIDMYRKKQLSNNYTFTAGDEILEQLSPISSINEALQIENEVYLHNLLNRLSTSDKQIIHDYYYKQLSISEIAVSLKISEAAARKRLQRAIASLKKMTGDENYEYKII